MRIPRTLLRPSLVAAGVAAFVATLTSRAENIDPQVQEAEAQRVAAVEKVRPAVTAVFAPGGAGGGSGVVISKDGYALTNFHVVEGLGGTMQCGLPDGVLYDAVLVGLDKVGDVALIKLLPQKSGQEFPFATLGDSDQVKAGDWSLAMGNPFLLATDFNPTVTYGMVSGVHRYQYPAGTLLEYTDCLQIDTSINPGNSGGPLFNMKGELIGINGRGSFEKRGRVNSGVGYAISINQIKNFMGHLRAGIDTDHATLGAFVKTEAEDDSGRLTVTTVLENSDVHRRGVEEGDELIAFAGRPINSVNQYKNVLGIFPKGWRMPLVYRHNNERKEVLVRLMQLQQTQQADGENKPKPPPTPPRRQPPARKSPASNFYEPKPGYANFYYNKLERARLLDAFKKHGDFAAVGGDWVMSGQVNTKQLNGADFKVTLIEVNADKDAGGGERAYHLHVSTLPELPAPDKGTTESKLRQAVRKADGLLRQHAKSFPQEFWANDTVEQLKDHVLEMQKNVATIQAELQDGLEELKKAAGERRKDILRWQALYDYFLGRLTAFNAYVYEYNYLLGQLRKEPPPRNPKVHRGWRMDPHEKLQSGADARKLAAEAGQVWEKMQADYRGTSWDERAQQAAAVHLGLHWVPTGGTKTMVRLELGALKFELDPLQVGQDVSNFKQPGGSGGLLTAIYQFRRLLTLLGPEGFEADFSHGGNEPLYPPRSDGKETENLKELRVDCEVLRTEHASVEAKWYFDRTDHRLRGFDVTPDHEDDPCEVYLSDYKAVDGRELPYRFDVRYANGAFGTFFVKSYQLAATK